MEEEALSGAGISGDDALELIRAKGSDLYEILGAANRVARHFRGNRAEFCGIVNAKSGRCPENCSFCAQSAHHATNAAVHGMIEEDALVRAARETESFGANRFGIVTAGTALRDESELNRVKAAIARTLGETTLAPCASLGILEDETLKGLKEAGLTRYHHNLETARSHFIRICDTHEYDEDVETVKAAKRAGLEVCSGGILGLGESPEQRVELALALRSLDVDCVPVNFLVPVKGTPLEAMPPLEPLECLLAIAMFRLVLPRVSIRVCAGRERNLGDLRSWAFFAGADGMMIGNFLTTTGRNAHDDVAMARALGFEPAAAIART
jgi:biotin synthase